MTDSESDVAGGQQQTAKKRVREARRRVQTKACPICGHEAWPLAFGMIPSNEQARMPKTEFAGCCIELVQRINPVTGEVEFAAPEWACQNRACGHWW